MIIRILAGGCGVADISGSCPVTRKVLLCLLRCVARGRNVSERRSTRNSQNLQSECNATMFTSKAERYDFTAPRERKKHKLHA